MTAEEKARVYAKKRIVLENRDKFSDEPNLRAAEYYAYKSYLAGHAEAIRWRDPKEELPDWDTQVMIKGGILKPEIWSDFENLHCTGYYCDGVWHVSPTDYYSIEIENPTGWRPIE